MAGKVKIRTVSKCTLAAVVLLSGLCLVLSIYGMQKYNVLRTSMQEYIECESAVQQFTQGSDTLTQQARLAASTGDTAYIDGYFQEANVDCSREKAIETISSLDGNDEALSALEKSMQDSKELMQTEYYVMCLVEEAAGTPADSRPEELQGVVLSQEDAALSADEKLVRAQELMVSREYELAKEDISRSASEALEHLSEKIGDRQSRAAIIFSDVFRKILFSISAFAVLLLINYLVMRHWVVKPLMQYNDSIKNGSIFPICGAYELQLLAKTYNSVFEENAQRERLMKHEAEHDALTGALNRRAFDQIISLFQKDERQFALILVDVDNFKTVNDTYGHAVGDLILQRVATLLEKAFRSIDHICRIGGDEFAVVMIDVTENLGYTIEEKIDEVNHRLAVAEGDIPAVTLSVGAAFADREAPGESIFKDADRALYFVKEHGRNGCHIYCAADAAKSDAKDTAAES